MPNTTLSLLRRENTGVIYADPAKPDMTVRFRNTSTNKVLNGVSVKNYLTEIIYNDNNPIEVADGVSASDAISIRFRVSGANLSAARITQIINSFAVQVQAWDTQNAFKGFDPTSAPVIVAAV